MRKFSKKRKIAVLFCLILIAIISFYIWGRYYVTYPKDISSKLSLSLHVDKSQYIQAEPVRLTVLICNTTDKQIVVKYPIKRRPFRLMLTKFSNEQKKRMICDVPIPRYLILCGTHLRWFHQRRRLVIKPDKPVVVQEWLMDPQFHTTDLGVGPTTFQAELCMRKSLTGYKSVDLFSNKVTIDYNKPQGKDLEAYKMITTNEMIDTSHGKFGPGFMYGGLIWKGGSYAEPVLLLFLEKYSDTSYAPYVKYSMAMSHRHHSCQTYGNRLLNTLETAPPNFPLIPEIYIALLNYYQHQYDLPRMAALGQSITINQLKILNPHTKTNLHQLIDKIGWWPPDTPREQIKADEAFCIREAVRISSNHWLTKDLLQAYGEHYSNELQFSIRQADKSSLYFYDKSQKQCAHITYHFDKSTNLKHVHLYGPLISFAVGAIKLMPNELQENLKLNKQDLATMKVDALLKGRTIEGTLFKDDNQDTKTNIPFSFHNINLSIDRQTDNQP